MKKIFATLGLFLSVAAASLVADSASAATITFPVIGSSSYSNDYNAPRANGCHCATDIIASKGQQIVSATDGVIDYVTYPEPSWGFAVIIRSTGGNYYWYLHINNDTPGTDNGRGGGMHAFAPDIKAGNPIKRGQLIGWVGDSGNAEGTVPHLHFEIHKDSRDGPTVNPYNSLKNNSVRIRKPVDYPQLPNEILPFNSWYKSKLNVARGNISGDSAEEVIVGMGYGNEPKVRIFNRLSRGYIYGFYASADASAKYGVDVETGDVDGDGINEIITGYRTASSPKITVFKRTQDSPLRFSKLSEFIAFEGNTSPRIAAGDINNDGKDEIIVAKGRNSSPAVRSFDAEGNILATSFVVPRDFRGGLDVASGDVANDGKDEIVVSALTEGSSFIRVFDGEFNKVSGPGFYAYGSGYRGGVYVSVGNATAHTPKAEILTVPNGSRPILRYFTSSGDTIFSTYFLEQWWEGYYDVAAGEGGYTVATGGNRRGSVR